MIVYKALRGLAPQYLADLFQPRTRDTRLRQIYDVSDISFPRTVKAASGQAIGLAGPTLWNSIPPALRHCDSLYSFKKQLKTYLFTLHHN